MDLKLKLMKRVIKFSEPEVRKEIEKYLRDEIYSQSYFDMSQISLQEKERLLLDAIYYLFVNEDVIDCNQDNCEKIIDVLYNTIFMRFKQYRVVPAFIPDNSLILIFIDKCNNFEDLKQVWKKGEIHIKESKSNECRFINKFLITLRKLDRIKNSN